MTISAFFAVIEVSTGKCLRTGRCMVGEVPFQGMPGEQAIETDGTIADDTHYWRDGWQLYPAQPEEALHFDFAAGVWVMPSAEAMARATEIAAAQAEIDAGLAYLAETEWQVTRFVETAQPMKEGVSDRRQAARDAISAARLVIDPPPS